MNLPLKKILLKPLKEYSRKSEKMLTSVFQNTEKEDKGMRIIVLYKTLLEGTQYWKEFNNEDDAYRFIHQERFRTSVYSYHAYKTRDDLQDTLISANTSINVHEHNKEIFNQLAKKISQANPNNYTSIKYKPESENKSKKKDSHNLTTEPKPEPKKDVFPYQSGASHSGVGKLRNGKKYSFHEEYGTIEDSKTRKTNHFNIKYAFNPHDKFHDSFVKEATNRDAIEKGKSIIKTNPKTLIRIYNLDKNGQESNLLYSYDFVGFINE